ncbi:hypothetical protein GNZ18_01870 [Actinomadura sp. NEAU-AAG5]|uniref:Uncharacterized protein n=1 Tax=Actinomadura litoris TaxID=2678616 RepID=A0A7K1KT37_9ACTN|nr:hypothetical protein [Actinomadura litoris]MUN35354.1 hypothetical protein [Actinomadura litoris]
MFERVQHPPPASHQIRDLGFQRRDMRRVFAQVSIIQPDEQRLKALPAMNTEDLAVEEVVQARHQGLFADAYHCRMPFRQVGAFRATDVVHPSPIVLAEHPASAIPAEDVGPQDVCPFGLCVWVQAGAAT